MFKTFIFFLAIMINTIFRCLFLYVFALLRWVPIEIFKKYFFVKIVKTGENWVATNNLVIDTLTKTRFEIIQEKELNFSKTKSYLIISNHRSWVDILVLQRIFNKQVPFLRFFIKQELKWIPFLGLAFKILDFPFMKRYTKEFLIKHPEKAGKDKETTKKICQKISYRPFSMINFVEGTRFTAEKHSKQNSPFLNLLTPKAGGLSYTLDAFSGKVDHLIDVTMSFDSSQGISFYDLANNNIKSIKIHLREVDLPKNLEFSNYENSLDEKNKIQSWLNQVWLEKDKILTGLKN